MRANSTADLFRAVLKGQSGDDLPRLNLGAVGCYQHPWRGVAISGVDENGKPFARCDECHVRHAERGGQ